MKKRVIALFTILSLSLVQGKFITYQTKKGDSYYLIGKNHGIDFRQIVQLNQGKKLYAGTMIKIPLYSYYRVKKGDNLYRLSKKFKIPVKKLSQKNGGMRELRTGEWLYISIEASGPIKKDVPKHTWAMETKKLPGVKEMLSTKTIPKKNPLLNKKFVWPASGLISERFGKDGSIMNYGLLMKLGRRNVVSVEEGKVQYVGKLRGLGQTVLVDHGDECVSMYAGLEEVSLSPNDMVKKGQRIAKGKQELFFSIYVEGSPKNPLRYIAKK